MALETYIAPVLETDPDDLAQDAFDSLADKQPGWEPAEGNIDTLVLEETSGMAALLRDLASQVPTTIFRYMGASLFGLPPIDASPAYVTSTWVASGTDGYTIPAGTQVTIAKTGTDLYGFEVLTDVDIIPGASQTASGEVEMQAIIPGTSANGLTAEPVLVDPAQMPWLASITLQNPDGTPATTSEGTDAELDSDYLNRLVQELELLTPTPVTPRDFATLYRTLSGVQRVLALDGYNPADSTYNNDKMVTLIAVDSAGEPVAAAIKDEAVAMFAVGGQYEREVNFIVNTDDPTYTTIGVTVNVTHTADYAAATVVSNVEAALANYFDPANWGLRATHEALGVSELSEDWLKQDTIYYLELTTLVNNVEGVDRVTSLTFGVEGMAFATSDLIIPGAAPLTRPGTMTVTTS